VDCVEGSRTKELLFLREKIKIFVASRASVNQGREIAGDDKGIAIVIFAESEWQFEGRDGRTNSDAVVPGLPEDCGLTMRGERVEERLAVMRIHSQISGNALLESGASLIDNRVLIKAGFLAPKHAGDDKFAVWREIDGHPAVVKERNGGRIIQQDSPVLSFATAVIAAAENDGLISRFPNGKANVIAGPWQLVEMRTIGIDNEKF